MNKGGRGRGKPGTDDGGPSEAPSSILSLSLIGGVSRASLVGIAVANAVIVARALGPAGLGQFYLFVQLVALLAVVADGGLSNSAAAAFDGNDAAPYLHGLVLRILPLLAIATVAVGAPVLALLHASILPHVPLTLVWMAFATLPFALYCNVSLGMLAGGGYVKDASVGQLVGGATWLGLTGIFVVWLQGGVETAAGVYSVSLILEAAVLAVMAVRNFGAPTTTSPASGTARKFTSFAARAFPGAVAYLVLLRLPAFILNVFHGAAAVGVFSAAQQLSERTLLPAVAVQSAAYWTMSTRSRPAATSAINRYVRFSWWGMTAVVVTGMVLAGPAVHLLLGAQYRAAVPLLRVLLPGVLFSACALILDTYFLNQLRRPGLLSLLCAVQAVTVGGLGILLIPHFAATGAAASLTIAEILGGLAYGIWHMRTSGSTLRDLVGMNGDDLRSFRDQASLLYPGHRGA